MSKKTLEGTRRKALNKSGFRARSKSKNGRKILNRRRKKKRNLLALVFKK